MGQEHDTLEAVPQIIKLSYALVELALIAVCDPQPYAQIHCTFLWHVLDNAFFFFICTVG